MSLNYEDWKNILWLQQDKVELLKRMVNHNNIDKCSFDEDIKLLEKIRKEVIKSTPPMLDPCSRRNIIIEKL